MPSLPWQWRRLILHWRRFVFTPNGGPCSTLRRWKPRQYKHTIKNGRALLPSVLGYELAMWNSPWPYNYIWFLVFDVLLLLRLSQHSNISILSFISILLTAIYILYYHICIIRYTYRVKPDHPIMWLIVLKRIGFDWIWLDLIGLDWIRLDWIGLDWIGLDWIGLHFL
jgi:hypothetical protein